MCDCFNQLEDSSNYSAGVLQTKCCQKYEFYHRKGYRKSNAVRIMAILSSTLWKSLYPLFSYCSTLYRLEVMSQCCNNISYIFIHTYFHCQASKAKQMVQQIADYPCSRQYCLPLKHYCMKKSMLLPPITYQNSSLICL